MALPMSKTHAELKLLDKESLFEYFCDNARFDPTSPPSSCYAIRVGSKTLFSDDTANLRDKFEKLVKRKPVNNVKKRMVK